MPDKEKTRDELLADAERALNDMDKGIANLRAIVDGWELRDNPVTEGTVDEIAAAFIADDKEDTNDA